MFDKDFVKLVDDTIKNYDQRVEREGLTVNPNDRLDNLNTELTRACQARGYAPHQIEGFVPTGYARAAEVGAGGGESHGGPVGGTRGE